MENHDNNDFYEGRRYEKRAKRRKVNRVLNGLIALVAIFILFFGYQLLFNKNEVADEPEKTEEPNVEAATSLGDIEEDVPNEQVNEDQENARDEEPDVEEANPDDEQVTEGTEGSNVIRTIENSSWAPVGTTQTEPHVAQFSKGTTDRKEMERAVSYALGLDQSTITYWWLGNNGGPNKVYATISTQNNPRTYKVYIEWVEGKGWKPTKVEELKENDSPTYKAS